MNVIQEELVNFLKLTWGFCESAYLACFHVLLEKLAPVWSDPFPEDGVFFLKLPLNLVLSDLLVSKLDGLLSLLGVEHHGIKTFLLLRLSRLICIEQDCAVKVSRG